MKGDIDPSSLRSDNGNHLNTTTAVNPGETLLTNDNPGSQLNLLGPVKVNSMSTVKT